LDMANCQLVTSMPRKETSLSARSAREQKIKTICMAEEP
jgi:hypothetical protein